MNLSDNQIKLLTICVKGILKQSCDWEKPDGLDMASINDKASICYDILAGGMYRDTDRKELGI